MNDDGVNADLFEQHDIAGKILCNRVIAHGVPAVFDHDRFPGVFAHVWQRIGQNTGFGQPIISRGYAFAVHCWSSVSGDFFAPIRFGCC